MANEYKRVVIVRDAARPNGQIPSTCKSWQTFIHKGCEETAKLSIPVLLLLYSATHSLPLCIEFIMSYQISFYILAPVKADGMVSRSLSQREKVLDFRSQLSLFLPAIFTHPHGPYPLFCNNTLIRLRSVSDVALINYFFFSFMNTSNCISKC